MWQVVTMTLAALSGGIAVGQKVIDKRVEDQLADEITQAKDRAMDELAKEVRQVLREKLTAFTVNLVQKAAIFAFAYGLYLTNHLSSLGLAWTTGAILLVSLVRDAWSIAPYTTPAWRLARRHGWSFRRVITEFVAGIVFKRAYAQALEAMQTGPARRWIAFSTYNAKDLSQRVADAVSDLARTASYDLIRPRLLITIGLAGAMTAAYGGAVALALSAA